MMRMEGHQVIIDDDICDVVHQLVEQQFTYFKKDITQIRIKIPLRDLC